MASAELSFAPHKHDAVHVNNPSDERMAARKLGQCGGCDNQTHKIGKAFFCCGPNTSTALTIPGRVDNGTCLKCHPADAAPVPAGVLAETMSAGADAEVATLRAQLAAKDDELAARKKSAATALKAAADEAAAREAALQQECDAAKQAEAAVKAEAMSAKAKQQLEALAAKAGAEAQAQALAAAKQQAVAAKADAAAAAKAAAAAVAEEEAKTAAELGTAKQAAVVKAKKQQLEAAAAEAQTEAQAQAQALTEQQSAAAAAEVVAAAARAAVETGAAEGAAGGGAVAVGGEVGPCREAAARRQQLMQQLEHAKTQKDYALCEKLQKSIDPIKAAAKAAAASAAAAAWALVHATVAAAAAAAAARARAAVVAEEVDRQAGRVSEECVTLQEELIKKLAAAAAAEDWAECGKLQQKIEALAADPLAVLAANPRCRFDRKAFDRMGPSCFDLRGVLYHFGTGGGRHKYENPYGGDQGITAFWSSLQHAGSSPGVFVQHDHGRDDVRASTSCHTDSGLVVDLGAAHLLEPDYYALRSDSFGDGNFKLRHWVVEASVDGKNPWALLRTHRGRCGGCDKKMGTEAWELSSEVVKGRSFRFFRIRQLGENSGSPNGGGRDCLNCTGFELYGRLLTDDAVAGAEAEKWAQAAAKKKQEMEKIVFEYGRGSVHGVLFHFGMGGPQCACSSQGSCSRFVGSRTRSSTADSYSCRLPSWNWQRWKSSAPGSNMGVVASMSSVGGYNGISYGSPRHFVGIMRWLDGNHYRVLNSTKNEPGSWMAVDLGADHLLVPTHYALQADDSGDGPWISPASSPRGGDGVSRLRNWVLEGSVNGTAWDVLREHVDDSSCNESMTSADWAADGAQLER
jgi:hypothetical protein